MDWLTGWPAVHWRVKMNVCFHVNRFVLVKHKLHGVQKKVWVFF